MRSLAILVGFLILAIGLVGLVAPGVLASLAERSVTAVGLYVVAAVRILIGLVLIGASSASRMPRTVRVIGIVALVAGLATPFIGVERARAILDWWLAPGSVVVRVSCIFAVAFGCFVLYAVTGRRRDARITG